MSDFTEEEAIKGVDREEATNVQLPAEKKPGTPPIQRKHPTMILFFVFINFVALIYFIVV